MADDLTYWKLELAVEPLRARGPPVAAREPGRAGRLSNLRATGGHGPQFLKITGGHGQRAAKCHGVLTSKEKESARALGLVPVSFLSSSYPLTITTHSLP